MKKTTSRPRPARVEMKAETTEIGTTETPGIEQSNVTDSSPVTFPELPILPDPSIEGITTGISDLNEVAPEIQTKKIVTTGDSSAQAILADGDFDISRKVLARIASLAASEIDGLVPPRGDAINKFIDSIQGRTDGIRVDYGSTEAAINMLIRVQFGTHIPDVTGRLRKRIAKRIHEMTGLNVSRIDIRVQDVTPGEETVIELKQDDHPAASA